MPRPRPPALTALGLAVACFIGCFIGCFSGDALRGEPCTKPGDCGPDLQCSDDGLCDEKRCFIAPPITVTTFAPDITLIVTFTASMNRPLIGETGPTRWPQVLDLVARISAALGDRVNLGLQIVPTVGPHTEFDPCKTDTRSQLIPAPNQGQAIIDALDPMPTRGEHALRTGLDLTLAAFAATDPGGLRPQAIVLISDEVLNCSDDYITPEDIIELFDNQLIPRVAEVAAAGFPVFVVGIGIVPGDGTAPYPGAPFAAVDPQVAFNALADAGGRPRSGDTRFYRGDEADALIAALTAIPDAFADCRVALDARPDFDDRLVVRVGPHTHRAQPDCEGGHGWRYVDPAKATVLELCPVTCADFRAEKTLTIEQRCPDE